MAFDEALAGRVRAQLQGTRGLAERKMFGGLAFLLDGHMCCGIIKNLLVVRVGPDAYADALQEPHVREMDFTGRPLTGMVYVAPGGIRTDTTLTRWIDRGTAFARTLPPRMRK